jgi:hypothetical protein
MRRSRLVICSPTVIAAALVLNACADVPSAPSRDMLHATVTASAAGASSSAGLVKTVHAATARYHSTTQATKAGYAVASPCVSHPTLGAMGFHWVNGALVDPVFDPLRPEAVLYAPSPNGSLKLVAVEYIVINVGQPAPTFDGHAFDVGGTPVPVAHWSLHVWVHLDNPNGIYTPFNPSVTCNP